MELGYNHPMGPLRLTDLVGLDVRLSIAEYLHSKLGSETFRPPDILRRMVSEGRLGKKTGKGFYDWNRARSRSQSCGWSRVWRGTGSGGDCYEHSLSERRATIRVTHGAAIADRGVGPLG